MHACRQTTPLGILTVRNDTYLGSSSLSMRPARSADAPFLETLYRSTRMDIQSVDAVMEQPGSLVAQQYQVFQQGVETAYPNANPGAWALYLELDFVVEETTEAAERLAWYPGARSVVN